MHKFVQAALGGRAQPSSPAGKRCRQEKDDRCLVADDGNLALVSAEPRSAGPRLEPPRGIEPRTCSLRVRPCVMSSRPQPCRPGRDVSGGSGQTGPNGAQLPTLCAALGVGAVLRADSDDSDYLCVSLKYGYVRVGLACARARPEPRPRWFYL